MAEETGKSNSGKRRPTAHLRVVINFDQFRELVAGKVVNVESSKIQIALEDIGYPQMLAAVAEAISTAIVEDSAARKEKPE